MNALGSSQALSKDYDWNSFSCVVCGICGSNGIEGHSNKQQPSNPNLVKVVEMQMREFLYCVVDPSTGKDRHVKQVQWSRPVEGWLKLNTDGSVISTSGLSRCGGLLRDNTGQWIVGFAKSISVSSSIAAELWALMEGLSLCIERKASAMEIELDASATISLVASNVNTNGDLSSLVDDRRELLLRLPQVKLSHCFREANFCVNALAKLGSASSNVSLVFVNPPPPPCYLTAFVC